MEPLKEGEFLCRCSADGVARCDEVVAAAKNELATTDQWDPPDDDYQLLVALMYNLLGTIEIAADQWFGVIPLHWKDHTKVRYKWFQCDELLDGVCAAYLWLKQVSVTSNTAKEET